jgi:autotransporter-associated beta strand protein
MLIINGGIAMFNGLLLASYALFCKHVMGGTCCEGVCQCGEGKCCDDVWHTDAGLCCKTTWVPTGENPCEGTPGSFFAYDNPCCCGCLEGEVIEEITYPVPFCCEPGIEIHVEKDGECKQRCCEYGIESPPDCSDEYPAECTNTSFEGSCLIDGCDTACCTENAEGTEMACVDATVPGCVSPSVPTFVGAFLNTKVLCSDVQACQGQCCAYDDDEYVETGVMSLADCIASGGEFQGVNTTFCLSCFGDTSFTGFRCRPPFDECCCEEKTSTGAGLVFTAPRNKQRLPPFDVGKSKQITIELQTESDILIHGKLFTSYSKCNLTFLVCHDELNVEPVPCGSNFANLSIKVCWADEVSDREDLVFPECQGMTIWLGNCESATEADHCTTYTTYGGGGLTSDVDIVLYGHARITASGIGPLVISEPITNQGTCARTLTIDGTSTQLNSINGGITDVPGGEKLTLVKEGVGTWRLGASSSFEGQTLIKQGTLIAGVGTGPSGSGVFGQATSQALLPMVGDSSNDATGFAAMLLEDGVVLNRSFQVATLNSLGQHAILGGANTSGTSTFAYNQECRTGRDVTLQCATGGTVDFGCVWLNSAGTGNHAFSYTIGSAGNLGTVRLSNPLATTGGTVSINYGTLVTGADDQIASTTPLSIGTETSTATLNLDGNSLTQSALTLIGSGSFITNTGSGALTMSSPATITVESGTGHQISSNMVLASNLTVHVPLGATLLISGNISGAFTLTRTGCGTLTLTGTNTSTIVNIPC